MEFTIKNNNNVYNILWPTTKTSNVVYKNWIDYFNKAIPGYAPLSTSQLLLLQKKIDIVNKDLHQTECPNYLPQIVSMRNSYCIQKIVWASSRKADIKNAVNQIISGKDIVQVAEFFDLPPVTLLRYLLLQKYGHKLSLDIVNHYNKMDHLDPIVFQMCVKAGSADITDSVANYNAHQNASKNEALFIQFFKQHNIALQSQDELTKIQTIEKGHAYATPDILFIDPVYVNGVRVHWIEYKDYFGSKIPTYYKRTKKQTNKYIKQYGMGVLCYHYGCIELDLQCIVLAAPYLFIQLCDVHIDQ